MTRRIWIWAAVFAAAAAAVIGHTALPGQAGTVVAVLASSAVVPLFIFWVFSRESSKSAGAAEQNEQ